MDFSCPAEFLERTSAPLFEIPLHTPLKAKCFKVYDGDTCRFMIRLHGDVWAFKARMLHINTAEMKTKCPIEKKMARLAKVRAVQLLDQKIVYITCTGTDLYGRKLVTIDLQDLGPYHTILINETLAFPFEGVRKFADIILQPSDIYCKTCTGTDKAKKNCNMWRSLLLCK